jgi:hypothetical protein
MHHQGAHLSDVGLFEITARTVLEAVQSIRQSEYPHEESWLSYGISNSLKDHVIGAASATFSQ